MSFVIQNLIQNAKAVNPARIHILYLMVNALSVETTSFNQGSRLAIQLILDALTVNAQMDTPF